jgi:hypothetical protein
VSTVNGVISLLSFSLSSAELLFSQKQLSQGSEILHWALSYKNNKIWGKKKIGGTPDFLGFFFGKKKSA